MAEEALQEEARVLHHGGRLPGTHQEALGRGARELAQRGHPLRLGELPEAAAEGELVEAGIEDGRVGGGAQSIEGRADRSPRGSYGQAGADVNEHAVAKPAQPWSALVVESK